MLESPDAVLLYIPLMKNLGMSWNEIKHTPNHELQGLLIASHEYDSLHSMDGYSDKDISEMAKNKPEVRSQYAKYMEKKRKYEEMVGIKRKVTFKGI
jgi:hypothetical protein|tara:strand:- start:1447 stop:1737 length:291 start_codon:yes stop_codon:yes gene_type:complete